MSKVIYIMGCGRSGTTILSIVLGNNDGMLNMGELGDYPEFNGRPNSYDENSPNYQFWKKVNEAYCLENGKPDYEELSHISEDMEHHKSFFFNYLNLISVKTVEAYKNYIRGLYNSIFNVTDNDIVIDSSKFPGRALSLTKYLDRDLYLIYLIRDPIGVVGSFNANTSQGSKGFFSANLYYFVINFFCNLLRLKIDKRKFIRIKYEDLISNPLTVVEKIQDKFNMDFSHSIKLLGNDSPLQTGFMFNGNRMRLYKEIKLVQKKIAYQMTLKNRVTRVFNGLWYL